MNRSRRTCLALAILFLAPGGCAVDQEKEVAVYRKVLDMPAPSYCAGQPLTLRDALLLANANNETLAVAGEDYLQALIARRRTVAGFLPTLDLAGNYGFRDAPGASEARTFDLSAGLDWELFSGLRDLNRYWRDTFTIQRRHDQLLAAQESLLLDAARVYYRILRDEARVRVLQNSLSVQEQRLRDARGRLEAKVARPLDVAQTEAQLAATRTASIDARRSAIDGRLLLALLTGAPVDGAVLVESYALPPAVADLQSYARSAAGNRRDLSAAQAAIDAARREVQVAWGQYYPTLTLNLNAFLSRDTIPSERDWEGLLVANVPIFAAGRIHAEVRAAWSFYRQALLVHSYLTRQVHQQVAQAYHDLRGSNERLGELRVRLATAQQAFEQADASYNVGLATNLERVSAQDALLEAQLELVSEQYDRKVFYLALLRSAGALREELQSLPSGTMATAGAPAAPIAAPTGGFTLAPIADDAQTPATRPAMTP